MALLKGSLMTDPTPPPLTDEQRDVARRGTNRLAPISQDPSAAMYLQKALARLDYLEAALTAERKSDD